MQTKSKLSKVVSLTSSYVVDSKELKMHLEIVQQRYINLVKGRTCTAEKG